ncbi:MAG: lysylphosphatidylglycerol synthase transmembrane domain-containing protein [Candidatus Aenigmatarchaeota archaeon]
MKKRLILFSISMILLATLLYFSNPLKVFNTLMNANLEFILMGIFFWSIGYLLRGFRWKMLLKRLDIKLSLRKCLKYYSIGLFFANLSPAKTGEPVRAGLVKKIEGKSFSKSMGSIFFERIMDLISMIIISILGMVFIGIATDMILWAWIAIILYITGITSFLHLVFSGQKLEKFLQRLTSIFSFIPRVEKLESKIEKFSSKMRKSIRKYKNRREIAKALVISLTIWVVNCIPGWFAFYALGYEVSLTIVVVVTVLSTLIGVLTFLPGNLGSGEILAVSMFSMFLTIPVSGLTSAVILRRFLNYWIYMLMGAILLLSIPKKILDI